MPKNYSQNAEDRSIFLVPSTPGNVEIRKGERADTSPFRAARLIHIDRIQPDPYQPRKSFFQETLESLAESIEAVGIIDPLIVEYSEANDCFQIISGERRYRAARLMGLDQLPCVVKTVDDKTRFVMQFVANLQRENIPPLEEAAGIKNLMERYSYTQKDVSKLINKSKSYISQILGLLRLSEPARKIVQTSELSKEALIRASRENDPAKQVDLLKSASDGKKTVRQIREGKNAKDTGATVEKGGSDIASSSGADSSDSDRLNSTFTEWNWRPEGGNYEISIRFDDVQRCDHKLDLIKGALTETFRDLALSKM